ncbi:MULTISPECIES: DUF305 domain-containing protein [unclassified Spirosoma]|uniref:DUF305 domain-containing protein n=1 Tax=Spirosoma linguale (strain ATCC 33905 / DSM 74 / LMG 10896 / Claus 1) TaxID=504472 RepID=D2QVL9_SPILD|nr:MULTISPECIES: DUF305 domain-containing protein [unclassified Spirosoma]ADB42851.1 protein of unknown function DUF305 [Spirosoma linguale DSM 74]MBN8820564.1 DUF305 domain-containing protein [Spirosoma sp.]OJW77701.1 MAG: hypothetical protein BGO59_28720 [Spirosoma sp. 48-14]
MKKNFLSATNLTGLALAMTLTLTGCDKNGSEAVEPEILTEASARTSSDDPNDQAFDRESDRVLGQMMRDMENMEMTGDPDMDFAMMMKMHHQGSIDLGTAENQYGKHAEAKKMADMAIKGDKESQTRLQSFLNGHPAPEKIDANVYKQFKKEMKTAMKQMIQAYAKVPNTADVDVDFVRRLIEHHKGAIAMATLQFKYGDDKAPTDEASIIITEQASALKELAAFANKHGIPNAELK